MCSVQVQQRLYEYGKSSILLRFLNALSSLNDFIIKRIVFLFLVKYIASGTLSSICRKVLLFEYIM